MLSRRGFLGYSGIGMLTLSAGCQPPAFQRSAYGDDLSTRTHSLAQKLRLKHLKNRLLGYPINMNTPSEEFFAWRCELLQAGIDEFAFQQCGQSFQAQPDSFQHA